VPITRHVSGLRPSMLGISHEQLCADERSVLRQNWWAHRSSIGWVPQG